MDEAPPIRLWRAANGAAAPGAAAAILHHLQGTGGGGGENREANQPDSFWNFVAHEVDLMEFLASQPYMRFDIEPDQFPRQLRFSSPKTGPSLLERITKKESTIIPPFEGSGSILITFPTKHEGEPQKTMRVDGSLLRHHSMLYRKFLEGQSTGIFTDSQGGFSLGFNRKYFRLIWWMLHNPGRHVAFSTALLRKDYLEGVLQIVDFLEMGQVKDLIQMAFPTFLEFHSNLSSIYQKKLDNSYYHHTAVAPGVITEERRNNIKERILSPLGNGAVVSCKLLVLLLNRYGMTSSIDLLLKKYYSTVRDIRANTFPLSSMLVEPELYSSETLGCMISTLIDVIKNTKDAKQLIM